MKRIRDVDMASVACGFGGHVTPALGVAGLRPEDDDLGVDVGDTRLARCLRCDSWIGGPADPAGPATIGELEPLELPVRGRALRQLIILRAIAIERGFHFVFFLIATVVLVLLEFKLGAVQTTVKDIESALDQLVVTNNDAWAATVAGWLDKLLELTDTEIWHLAVLSGFFMCINGAEVYGLWTQRRWAEYLTVIEVTVLIPFEVHALIDRVTWLRVATLIVNLLILVYIVWSKRLFGLGRLHPEPAESPPDVRASHFAEAVGASSSGS